MLKKKPFQRLPKNVVPKHYDLELKPNLHTFKFDGRIIVKLSVKDEPRQIILHAIDLQIEKVCLEYSNGVTVSPVETKLLADDETMSLIFAEIIPTGESTLCIEFSGEINDKMKGFYRSRYQGPNGEERFAGVTQFAATDARRCFPCWDEPAIKATFDITLQVPADLVAISNMPVTVETSEGDTKTLKFATTPIMSTYLVAIVVGEYDYVEDTSEDGVLVRVYTPMGKKEQGAFALEVATKVLPYYKQYFNIAYPLPKMDLIAIADFSLGAMENWGLVMYRETFLLVDPQNSSAVSKQWVALVVGHELAHQWFGNLVTMEWWTHLWLNEGYATFVEFLCVNHLFPEYDIWTQFVTETYIKALELDRLKNSHPIEVAVGHPDEIDEIFDVISYNKGASIIRMLHRYIGDEDFRKGMNLYLTRHQYSNTFTEDLWAALGEASNKPVGAVMSTWTTQMGFPVVRVTSSQQESDRLLTLTQEKFCGDGLDSQEDFHWIIPVSISTQQNPDEVALTMLLEKKTQSVVLKGVSADDWVKVNPGAVGYYRTHYTSGELSQLVPAIRNQSLPPLDRLGLLDDLFAMVQAGHTPTVEFLKLMEAFFEETNFTVWSSIDNCLSKLSVLLSHTNVEDSWRLYCRSLVRNVAEQIGWEAHPGETHLHTLLRSLALDRMITSQDPTTIAEAKKRFGAHKAGVVQIPADLRSSCYRAVLLDADESTFLHFLEMYRSSELQEEKKRISQALGAIQDVKLLEKVLAFAVSEDVRSQDTVFVIMSVANSRLGRDLVWDFFKENWKMLMDRYQGGFLLTRLVKCATINFASEESALEVEEFFKSHNSPGTERTVQQSLETIRLNASWLKRDLESTAEQLKSYQ